MKRILIIGAKGSMGQRYQAILNYLGIESVCVDKEHNRHFIAKMAAECEGAIIATPTQTHADFIRLLLPFKQPILCEKPVTKSVDELKALLAEIKQSKTPFRMMYQYKLLAKSDSIGKSFYNYFRHGNDGLIWDCLQIIGLARGELTLGENSPVWRCMINGKPINIRDMDAAYIGYVQLWLQKPAQDLEEILKIHEKTAQAENHSDGRIH